MMESYQIFTKDDIMKIFGYTILMEKRTRVNTGNDKKSFNYPSIHHPSIHHLMFLQT